MNRILFEFGNVVIYSYGLFVATGFLVAIFLILRQTNKINIEKNKVFDLLVVILLGGLVGARSLFVILNWEYYSSNIFRVFALHEGGLAIQGGIVGGILAGALFMKFKKMPVFLTADVIALYLPIAQAIGRIGCLMNGCCYGKVIHSGIGINFPGETVVRFPTQICYTIAFLVLFLFLRKVYDNKIFNGQIFSLYLIFYGALRMGLDFLRGDELVLVGRITLSQTLGASICFSGLILFLFLKILSLRKK